MHRITILTKPNCPACDAACKVVDLVLSRHMIALIERIDITTDADLLAKYQNDVPVVLVDGQEKLRGTVDPDKLARCFFDEFGERLVAFN